MSTTPVGPEIEGLTFVRLLGSGGYSDVFEYTRRQPRMAVAVKILKDGRISDAERAQFAAEAEVMAELSDHPYVVQVFWTGTTSDGRPYLVMKFYPADDLATRCARERFSVAEALRTGIQLASAVETAHRAGILHRDIKPANVLVSQYGDPGLTDFGIAGRTGAIADSDDPGVSIPWSPPEVLNGTSNGSVVADVYSLGATIWQLLVGRSPFTLPGGDNSQRAMIGRVLQTPPPSTGRADVPASLDRLLQQSMAKPADARPKSALELARLLQVVEQDQRFGRTEIVVPELQAPRDRPSSAGGDATRLRAPTRPTPIARRRPVGQPVPSRPAARPIVAAPAPATVVRPAVPTPVTLPGGAAATVMRPTAPTPTEAVPTLARRRGTKRKYVLAAGSVALAVLVAVGAIIAFTGSHGGGRGQAHDETGSPAPIDPASLGGTSLTAPVVQAKYDATAHVVTFSWTVDAGEANVRFLWSQRGKSGTPTSTNARSVQVRTTTPESVCITVQAVPASGGAGSPQSPYVCGAR